MDSIDPSKGMSTLDATMEDSCGDRPKAPRKKMGPVEKEASVHEEMKRMQKLPANSTYVTHRLRVLNKILQLLSIQLGKSIVTHATIEGLKTIPGYKIVAKSIRDVKESNKQEVDVKALQADLHGLQKEFSEYKKLHEHGLIDKPSADLKSPNTVNILSALNQKPEDVIRVFMMKEFMGRQFFDDLMVPPVAPRKK